MSFLSPIFRILRPAPRGSRPARRLAAAVLLAALLGAVPALSADLRLVDEEEIYVAIDKLNAMGLLPGFFANTRPYDMQAVREAVGKTSWSGMALPESVAELGRWVAYQARPAATLRAGLSVDYSRYRRVEENGGGVPTPEGFSVQAGAIGRYEPVSWFSVDGKAVAYAGEEDDRGGRAREYSVQLGHKYFSLQAGEITTWYGPGRRGALIFSNNAEPYPGVRLHNPVPIPLPWIFSFLGHVQYDLFVAQLDEDRPVPETYLSGMRIALRPNRYLEFGVSRAMHFKGEGDQSDFDAWWEAFKGEEDRGAGSENERNQLGGFDATLTLPFRVMPVQLYLELAGEDQSRDSGIEVIPMPEKWSALGGVFFPALFGTPKLDLRVEYADNHFNDEGFIWYRHSFSPHEYKGRILGHPMGTDARMWFFQWRWFFLPSTHLELSLDLMDRYYPGPAKEDRVGFRMAFLGWFTRSLRADAGFLVERSKNVDGVAGDRRNDFASWIGVSWQYAGGGAAPSSKEKP